MLADTPPSDVGEEKRKLSAQLGAEKWIDFAETKDLVKDVMAATGGLGAHAAVITAGSVRPSLSATRLRLIFRNFVGSRVRTGGTLPPSDRHAGRRGLPFGAAENFNSDACQ